MAQRSKGVIIPISASDNTDRAFASVNAQVEKLRTQVAMLRTQASPMGAQLASSGREVGDVWHSATTEVQATSAAIRTLDGNPGIRSIERFLITIPGVGSALLAAFPVIGAFALAGAVGRGIEKLIEMKDAAAQLAAAITKAFDEAISKEREQADQLLVSNDRLEDTIDKLEHKPSNGLVNGIDEARVETDKLGDSMQNAAKQAEALFNDKFKVGFFDKLLNGTKSTDPVKDEVMDTLNKVEELKNKYASVVQDAADSGNSKAHIDELNQMMLGHVQDVFTASTKKLQQQLKTAQDSQLNDQDLGGTGARFQPLINSLEGALGLYDQQERVIGSQYRQSVLAPQAAQEKGDTQPKNNGAKDAFDARIAGSEREVGDAQRKAAASETQATADAAKNAADLRLAQLEDQHKRELISDQDFYAQKAKLQIDALNAQESANLSKQGGDDKSIRDTVIQFGKDKSDPFAQLKDAQRIAELQKEVNDLEDKRASIVAKRKQLEMEADTEAFSAAKKQVEESEKLAAQVEAIRGGSTVARTAQSDAEYTRNRKAMVVNGDSAAELGDFDYQHQAGDADIGLKGAEDTDKNVDSSIETQRSAVKYQESTGQISAIAAQQKLIDLDSQEADALQPVLAAYEKMAALNVDGAAEKVVALKEQIAELKQPVSEVSQEIRGQLDSAFEQLFVNMDRGKKAWSQFKKSIESDVMKDTYKQAVEPLLQTAMSVVVPHAGGATGSKQGSSPTAASAIGGFFTKAFGMPSVKGGGGGQPIVQIINLSSTPVQGTATSQSGQSDSSGITDMIRGPVTQIILEDLEHGGSIGQAFSGAGSGGLLSA